MIVAVAAVVLASGALGFLVWSVTTQSPAQLAWLTSMATVLAVVLPAWAMSAAMLAWVLRSSRSAAHAPDAASASTVRTDWLCQPDFRVLQPPTPASDGLFCQPGHHLASRSSATTAVTPSSAGSRRRRWRSGPH